MELFESIYYDLLIEGKSPEEILRILKYKFKNVPEQIIDYIFKIDPTKKKSYTTWVLMHYDQEKHIIDESLKDGSLKRLFSYLQSHQDAQLSKYDTLEDALYLVSSIDLLQKDSDDPRANDFDIVYKSPEWIIAVPNTYEASHKLGENTDWCTAGYKYSDGQGYYNNYLRNYGGKYFINFDLRENEHLNGIDYPFKRYQYHFESNQFMNAFDDPVDFEDTNMPEGVVNYYEKNGYSFDKMSQEEREEQYQIERYNDGVSISPERHLWLLQEYDHENYELAQPNMATYMLYDINYDDYDPVTYQSVEKKPLYIDDAHDIFILNTKWHDNTEYNGNLSEYDGTQECQPTIVTFNNSGKAELIENVKYYKVMEVYGFTFVTYFTSREAELPDTEKNKLTGNYEKVKTTILAFGIEGSGLSSDINLPINGNFEPIEIIANYEVQAMYPPEESALLLEVVWDNGYHTLLNFTDSNDCEVVVRSDKPLNGEYFTLSENEEGDYIIQGMFRNYNGEDLTYENRSDKKLISHFERDLFYNDLYIVQTVDKKFNIYNKNTKQLLFDENFASFFINDTNKSYVEKYGLIIGQQEKFGKRSFYSLKDGQKIGKDWDYLQPSPKNNFFAACYGEAKTSHFVYIINRELRSFGPYYSIYKTALTDNEVFVTERTENGERGQIKLLDFEKGEYKFNGLAKLTPLFKSSVPVVFGLNENNECLMYNYVTGQLLDRDIMVNQTPELVRKKGFEKYLEVRHSSTGKLNLVNFEDGTKLLPEDVDNIGMNFKYIDYDISHMTVDNYLAFENNSTEYILHIDNDNVNILPTPNGIVTGETSNIYNYRTKGSENPCITFTIHDGQDNEEILVTYNYVQNTTFVGEFSDYNPNGTIKILKNCEPEIQQRVMQALNPQKAQFVAQYNEMINRMKSLL